MILERFHPAITRIKDLEKFEYYSGAFIFGSVAREDTDDNSDLDVKVIINDNNSCRNISHPFINGVKLDITFISQEQLIESAKQEQTEGRIPMIAESIILFDKNNRLQKIKDYYKDVKPLKFSPEDYILQQFFIYHADEKIRRNIKKDPDSALLAMTLGIGELIKIHYRLNGKYRISSKRMFKDLDLWDKTFAGLLREFIKEGNVDRKFKIWEDVVNYIVKPMGGKLPIENNICACDVCRKGIELLSR